MRALKWSLWLCCILLLLFLSCALNPERVSPLPSSSPLSEMDLTPRASLLVTTTPDPAMSPLIISEIVHSADGSEIIIIKNITTSEQNINGWSLLDPQSLENTFLPDITLPPGGTFKVCNGLCSTDINADMRWLDRPALQNRGDFLMLLNPAGRVIWNYVYY